MTKRRNKLARFAEAMTLFLCLTLAIVPLYNRVVFDAAVPSHWSTLFDLPSDLLGFDVSQPRVVGLLMRGALFVLVEGLIAFCIFKRLMFRWLPVLLLSIGTALTCRWLWLSSPSGEMLPVSFGVVVAFSFFCAISAAFLFLDSPFMNRRR
jgi:hypothetical protein